MGTTYQAQVEVFFAAEGDRTAIWQSVSRWELQKDYSFAAAWYEVSEQGFPAKVRLIGTRPDPRWGYDLDSMAHGSGEAMAGLTPNYEDEEPWIWFVELQEHVRRLIASGNRVRVLTWGE